MPEPPMNPASRILAGLLLVCVTATSIMSFQPAAAIPDTLEGRVVWKGELPEVEDLTPTIRKHADHKHLLLAPASELLDPKWRIDPATRGVANVVVFLKRPKNGVLPIQPIDRVRNEPIVLDTPFAAIRPYMSAFYPEWNDGANRGKTGQKLIVTNSAPVPHNLRFIGNPKFNPESGVTLPPGKDNEKTLKPQPFPVVVNCDIHNWMSGYVWVFDHPYFAITKADGSFSIPRVPAGLEVQVSAWHPGRGWLLTKEGRTMKLERGRNVLDVEMKAE
jgi:hypothetical protein